MTDATDLLLDGPRGRRLCLACAESADERVRLAVFWRGRALDPNPGTLLRFGAEEGPLPADAVYTDDDVAALVRGVDPASIDATSARRALRASVDAARYWQEPDGADHLAAAPPVRAALHALAERLIALIPHLDAASAAAQWAVDRRPAADRAPLPRDPAGVLTAWTDATRDDEERAARDRPRDPRAHWSGIWWSVPTQLLTTRRTVVDALDLIEDSFGDDVATLIPVRGAGRILEIRSADDWAALCRAHPVVVTASRRHDWFRVTGRDGAWVIPDWERVAERWDAVHLTTLGYVSAATRLIEVDDERATVIAGWAPDSTLWLRDDAREADADREEWVRPPGEQEWSRASG